jgi:hypothetical protein
LTLPDVAERIRPLPSRLSIQVAHRSVKVVPYSTTHVLLPMRVITGGVVSLVVM